MYIINMELGPKNKAWKKKLKLIFYLKVETNFTRFQICNDQLVRLALGSLCTPSFVTLTS